MPRRHAVWAHRDQPPRQRQTVLQPPGLLGHVGMDGQGLPRGIRPLRHGRQHRQRRFLPTGSGQGLGAFDLGLGADGHLILFTPRNGSSSASSSEKPKWAKPAFISGLNGAVTFRTPPRGVVQLDAARV